MITGTTGECGKPLLGHQGGTSGGATGSTGMSEQTGTTVPPPLDYRLTTEGFHPRPVVRAVVGPELPLDQQFLGGGVPGGTTTLNTGSTGLSRQTGTFVPSPVYHHTRYRSVSPLSGTWSGGLTGTACQRYNRSRERYYHHEKNCTVIEDFGNLSLHEWRVYGGCK